MASVDTTSLPAKWARAHEDFPDAAAPINTTSVPATRAVRWTRSSTVKS